MERLLAGRVIMPNGALLPTGTVRATPVGDMPVVDGLGGVLLPVPMTWDVIDGVWNGQIVAGARYEWEFQDGDGRKIPGMMFQADVVEAAEPVTFAELYQSANGTSAVPGVQFLRVGDRATLLMGPNDAASLLHWRLAIVGIDADENGILGYEPPPAGEVGTMPVATYDPQGITGDAFARANHTGTQAITTVTGLAANLAGKASVSHTHSIEEIPNLPETLAAKAGLVNGKVDPSQIPALAITSTHVVTSEEEQAALFSLVQEGDVVVRTDAESFDPPGIRSFIAQRVLPPSTVVWVPLSTPGGVVSINGQAGAVVLTAASVGALAAGNNLSELTDRSAARSFLELGTAATKNTGTLAGNVIMLDGSGKMPAVDGSQLTNLPTGGGSSAPLVALIANVSSGAPPVIEPTGTWADLPFSHCDYSSIIGLSAGAVTGNAWTLPSGTYLLEWRGVLGASDSDWTELRFVNAGTGTLIGRQMAAPEVFRGWGNASTGRTVVVLGGATSIKLQIRFRFNAPISPGVNLNSQTQVMGDVLVTKLL